MLDHVHPTVVSNELIAHRVASELSNHDAFSQYRPDNNGPVRIAVSTQRRK